MANSFDLWQRDAFFSAAERVQESADIMESTYRMWIKEKKQGPEDLDELSRELQTALGTAKWQLEEFERAVQLSHGHCCDDMTTSRHKHFVAAIGSQILHVEAALREALCEEGKQHLQWVNLGKEECDDLAKFLSGTPQIPQIVNYDSTVLRPSVKSSLWENHHNRKDEDLFLDAPFNGNTFDEKVYINVDTSKHRELIMNLKDKEIRGMRNGMIRPAYEITGTRRTWSSANFGALKILINDEDEEKSELITRAEATPKEKGSKSLFLMQKCGQHPQGAINLFNQFFSHGSGFQRQFHSPPRPQLRSIQLTLALMLSIFLIVPFLLYST